MKKTLFGILACLALSGLVLAGCEGLMDALTDKRVTGVRLDRPDLELKADQSKRLNATISPSDATNKEVQWSSDDPSVAVVIGTGLSVEVEGKAEGETWITVRTNDGGYTDRCRVTVTATGSTAVTEVSLDKAEATISVDRGVNLTAVIDPTGATDKRVYWSSSKSAVADVTGNGLRVVVTGKLVGTAVITVTTADGNKTARCVVEVTPAGAGDGEDTDDLDYDQAKPVTGVTLDQSALTLAAGGGTEWLIPIIEPWDADNQKVTWSSDNPSIANVNPNTGQVTGVNGGSATITVTTVDGNKTATCTVTVTAGSSGGNTEPKNIRIQNIPAEVFAYGQDGGNIGVFPLGTTLEQAMSLGEAIVVAGGDLEAATIEGSGPYTVTIPLVDVTNGNPWTGNGIFTVYMALYGDKGHFYEASSVSITSGTATISFSNAKEIFPEDISIPEPDNSLTITVTGIPPYHRGKGYMAELFPLFPDGIAPGDTFGGDSLAYGKGTVSGTTINIAFSSDGSSSSGLWNAADGSYSFGLVIVDEYGQGIEYVGIGTVTLSNRKAAITFSDLIDVTGQTGDIPVPTVPMETLFIAIGFNQDVVTITGDNGSNIIYKSSSSPSRLTLSATGGYTNIGWYVDGSEKIFGDTLTIDAADYDVRNHSVTFTGYKNGAPCSQIIPFRVLN